MKKAIGFLCIIMVLGSCKTALFDAQPGKAQNTFPAELQGSYYIKVPSGFFRRVKITDTVYFDVTATSFTSRDSNTTEKTVLDENTGLRLVNNKYHVLTTHDEDYKQYWNYTLVEPTKKGAKFYVMIEERNTKLPKYFKRTFISVNNAGDSVFAYKNNDAQLVKYIEKVVRKGDALELVRIQK
jgi:ABC-type antimicrobial peptide transport system permease subunit